MTNPTPQPPASDMTLRDWFAGQATECDIAYYLPNNYAIDAREGVRTQSRLRAKYAYADAMMEARKA